jgi:hypothetical protein
MTTWSRSRPGIVTQPAVSQSYQPVSTGDGGHTSCESATRILLQETRENKDKIACIDLRTVAGRLPPHGGRAWKTVDPTQKYGADETVHIGGADARTHHWQGGLIPASCLTWLKTAQMVGRRSPITP